MGASPGTVGRLGPGHPGGAHLRLEAILNTSPLLCALAPPSPSSSCSMLSMLSRSCSCWSSSLHSKGQELPWEEVTSHPGSPAVRESQWGRTSTSHGVIFQHLSCPLGWNSRKANTSSLLLAPKPAEEPELQDREEESPFFRKMRQNFVTRKGNVSSHLDTEGGFPPSVVPNWPHPAWVHLGAYS